jgi:hypothetical protein
VPAAGVVGEAMVMLTLADFALEKLGGDSMPEVLDHLAGYRARIESGWAERAADEPVEVGSGGDD